MELTTITAPGIGEGSNFVTDLVFLSWILLAVEAKYLVASSNWRPLKENKAKCFMY